MTTPPVPVHPTEVCHCGHSDDQHDDVAARYCRATLNGVLPRGCACLVGTPAAPRSYDRR